tara:strand:+ start:77 stop:400 length:324 start_codon:yes stop_codon:yes gene_type:complete
VHVTFGIEKYEDVNGDGLLDVVCHFYTQETAFQDGDTNGVLKGFTTDGVRIQGTDTIRPVPDNEKKQWKRKRERRPEERRVRQQKRQVARPQTNSLLVMPRSWGFLL